VTICNLTTNRIGPFIDRGYRETSRLQWVRETAVNAIEAGATQVYYGVEWQGVTNHRVYRRTIADDGAGMSADELHKFFSTYGGGGKPIGAVHENFGIGAKTTLLPWNHLGVVVISWNEGHGNMIRIRRDPVTEEYGLQEYDVTNEYGNPIKETVIDPDFDDDEFGVNWSMVKPHWIGEHGTVIVLLGNNPQQDTIRGDPERDEDGIRLLSEYLSNRFWRPACTLRAIEFSNYGDKTKWPVIRVDRPSMGQNGYMRRTAYGAEYYIATPSTFPKTELKHDTMLVDNGRVVIDWYLWSVPDKSYRDNRGPRTGSISVLYKNELYNQLNRHDSFRSFGICEAVVRNNLWLVIRPPEFSPGNNVGVYSRSDRSALLLGGTKSGADELPITQWAEEFANNMPVPIIEALKEARKDKPTSLEDDAWLQKMLGRFGPRLIVPRLRPQADSSSKAANSSIVRLIIPAKTTPPDPNPKPPGRRRPRASNSKTQTFAIDGNDQNAIRVPLRLGMPHCVYTDDSTDLESGMLAAWTAPNTAEPTGLIQIYRGHGIFVHIIKLTQNDYQGYHADKVRDAVEKVYKLVAVCKVAQIYQMRQWVSQTTVDDMLSPRSLTTGLLGMIAEEAMIRQLLTATIGRRRKSQPTKKAAA
jgi:hypothetical protein